METHICGFNPIWISSRHLTSVNGVSTRCKLVQVYAQSSSGRPFIKHWAWGIFRLAAGRRRGGGQTGESTLDFSNYDVGALQPRELTIVSNNNLLTFCSPLPPPARPGITTSPPSWTSAAVAAGDTHTDSLERLDLIPQMNTHTHNCRHSCVACHAVRIWGVRIYLFANKKRHWVYD